MKNLNFCLAGMILSVCLIFESCGTDPVDQTGKLNETLSTLESNTGENLPDSLKVYYFDFDEVDYYHTDTGHVFFPNDSLLSNDERLFQKLFEYEFPESVTDTSFVSDLPRLGYQKEEVDPSKNDALNDLFREKNYDGYEVGACIPEYRDILIFRKTNHIIGIAKICFTCSAFAAVGTEANTNFFGSYDGFSKLGALLHEELEN